MTRTPVGVALTLALLVGCGASTGGGGGTAARATPTPPPEIGPFGEFSAPPLVLATPTPLFSPPADATVSRVQLVEAGVFRAGTQVAAAELAEMGWTIDVGQGEALFYKAELGTERIRWEVPPSTFTIQQYGNIWLNGDVTSRVESNLNLQIGLKASGFEVRDPATSAYASTSYYEETGAFSQGGVQADAPELRRDIQLRETAVPGEEARIGVNLGWQAQGCEVVYRFVYQP